MNKLAEPLLRIRAPIDIPEWERMHAEIRAISAARVELLHQRFVNRTIRYLPKPRPNAAKAVYAIGTFGLAFAALMAAVGGIPYKGYRLELLFAAFFAAVMLTTCLILA